MLGFALIRVLPASLVADGDGLHLEGPQGEAEPAPMNAGRKVLREISFVSGVKFVVIRKVRAKDLYVGKIVHGHVRLSESGLIAIKEQFDFILDFSVLCRSWDPIRYCLPDIKCHQTEWHC